MLSVKMHSLELLLLLSLVAFTSPEAAGSPQSPDVTRISSTLCKARKMPPAGACDSEMLLSGELGGENLRAVSPSLPGHYWEGEGCRILCFCGAGELMCCPREVFFDPTVLPYIPCDTPIKTKD
ncbi:scrapie-responsive protein 1 [Lampetra fluviatilis]